jgi:glycopeptide antibiotics resistance protein
MLQSYLISIETAALVFLIASLLLLVPICIVHYQRFGYLRPAQAATFYAFLFYGLCAIFLVTLPLPVITPDFCTVHTLASQMRVVPFQFVADIIRVDQISIRHFNLVSAVESPVFLQAFFNFLLLMPLGFFLRYYFLASWKVAAAIAFATTLAFEITQITGIYGLYPCPYRTFDIDDVILNASGAMVGYAMMPLFAKWLPDLQQGHPMPQSVSPFRRLVAFLIDWFIANSLARMLSAVLFAAPDSQHPLGLDVMVYAVWFVGVPLLWRGHTLGKYLVKIRLTCPNGNQVKGSQLCIRYGLLIALPIITEVGSQALFTQQLEQQGYIGGLSAFVLLSLLALEVCLLAGLVLIRRDRRGLHELAANTWQRLA